MFEKVLGLDAQNPIAPSARPASSSPSGPPGQTEASARAEALLNVSWRPNPTIPTAISSWPSITSPPVAMPRFRRWSSATQLAAQNEYAYHLWLGRAFTPSRPAPP
ncbi:hypothetical protein HS125_18815 [bacterium]|nr:hypothetical protein [bacterium]